MINISIIVLTGLLPFPSDQTEQQMAETKLESEFKRDQKNKDEYSLHSEKNRQLL